MRRPARPSVQAGRASAPPASARAACSGPPGLRPSARAAASRRLTTRARLEALGRAADRAESGPSSRRDRRRAGTRRNAPARPRRSRRRRIGSPAARGAPAPRPPSAGAPRAWPRSARRSRSARRPAGAARACPGPRASCGVGVRLGVDGDQMLALRRERQLQAGALRGPHARGVEVGIRPGGLEVQLLLDHLLEGAEQGSEALGIVLQSPQHLDDGLDGGEAVGRRLAADAIRAGRVGRERRPGSGAAAVDSARASCGPGSTCRRGRRAWSAVRPAAPTARPRPGPGRAGRCAAPASASACTRG